MATRRLACGVLNVPDGRTLLATSGHGATVRLWDLIIQAELKAIAVETPVHAITLLSEGVIAVAMDDGVAVLSVGLV